MGPKLGMQPLDQNLRTKHYVQALGLGPIHGIQPWVLTLGPNIGTKPWDQNLGPNLETESWDRTMGPKPWDQPWNQHSDSTSGPNLGNNLRDTTLKPNHGYHHCDSTWWLHLTQVKLTWPLGTISSFPIIFKSKSKQMWRTNELMN